MPRNVKLDCYTINIHQRGHPDDLIAFDDFFASAEADGSRKAHSFFVFFQQYMRSFGNNFVSVGASTRALHIPSGATKIKIPQRVIYGMVEGGPSGYAFDLKNRRNASSSRTSASSDDVSVHKFYYLLWLPDDYTTGYLLLHGYSDTSIADLFRSHLAKFVRDTAPDYVLVSKRFYDREQLDAFREHGDIDRVILRRKKLSADAAENLTNITEIDSGKLNLDFQITGLSGIQAMRDRILAVIQGEQPEIFTVDDLAQYGLDGNHDTIVEYQLGGRSYKAYKSKGWDFFPTLYLTEVPLDANGLVNERQMLQHMLNYLELIKAQIGYTAIRRGQHGE